MVHVAHSGRAPGWAAERTLALGSVGGLGEVSPAEFGSIRTVIADEEGRIYVADGMAAEIRVFDGAGDHIRTLGRRGAGPGEIEGLLSLAWLGDSLVVMDHQNARFTVLDREGQYVGQWPWMRLTGTGVRLYPTVPDEVYGSAYQVVEGADGRRGRSVWVRLAAGTGPTDTLAVPEREEGGQSAGVLCRGDGIAFFRNRYGEALLSTPAPGLERAVARSTSYRIAFLDPAGDTVRVVSRDAPAVALPDSDWIEVDTAYTRFRTAWRGADCEGSVERPAAKPILRNLYFTHDGGLLIEHETADGPAFDVYDTGFRWIATIPAPERDGSVPPFLRDGRLYVAARDSLHVPRVEVYRIGR